MDKTDELYELCGRCCNNFGEMHLDILDEAFVEIAYKTKSRVTSAYSLNLSNTQIKSKKAFESLSG